MTMFQRLWTAGFLLVVSACSSIPTTHHYTLVPEATAANKLSSAQRAAARELVLSVEPLEVDAAYDDARMVYRPGRYQLEYYHYHQWSAPPGLQVSDFLREALARTGYFTRVTGELLPNTKAVLRGRITALEELDVSETEWLGRIALDLYLENPRTGELLWSQSFERREPLAEQSPAGLAKAVSSMLARIVDEIAPELAEASYALKEDLTYDKERQN